MEEAIKGAVLGGIIGVILVFFEVTALKKNAKERAEKLHRVAELDETERLRIKTLTRFAFILPIAFGAAFWWIWG
jgi:hypothetical protein